MILDMNIKIDGIDDEFLEELDELVEETRVEYFILNPKTKEEDTKLDNFTFSISHSSLKNWSQKGIMNFDYNKIGLQSDYPEFSYDELLDGLLKDISDLTFRAEQTIAAGGTRTILKTFKLL